MFLHGSTALDEDGSQEPPSVVTNSQDFHIKSVKSVIDLKNR